MTVWHEEECTCAVQAGPLKPESEQGPQGLMQRKERCKIWPLEHMKCQKRSEKSQRSVEVLEISLISMFDAGRLSDNTESWAGCHRKGSDRHTQRVHWESKCPENFQHPLPN